MTVFACNLKPISQPRTRHIATSRAFRPNLSLICFGLTSFSGDKRRFPTTIKIRDSAMASTVSHRRRRNVRKPAHSGPPLLGIDMFTPRYVHSHAMLETKHSHISFHFSKAANLTTLNYRRCIFYLLCKVVSFDPTCINIGRLERT